ncbi:uncharacterized protein LOC111404361 [Olea europaea var. sylvestris]|uniref:uncharacterized protein LOC111404361 n=1 Tax=Olea europaea var. sylvestris TaxID=158386 RepID=UPI000C1CDA03|nr:uncharacterized protein LOC111404361 [Olea europaea var. sylvestris]
MESNTNSITCSGDRPTVMVTNDDGIDAPGLRALVSVLVSSNRFNVLVCAPDSEKSAVSHGATLRTVSAKPVEISGATAFAVSGQLQLSVIFCHGIPNLLVDLAGAKFCNFLAFNILFSDSLML